MAYDLILRSGRVIDPSQNLDAIADVAFSAGKVARVGPRLDADGATDVHDVSGQIVVPGLIDLHTHVYWGGTSLGIDAEEFCRTSGVTTAIDTGSAGPGNFAGFRKHVIERSAVRILAYLDVSHAGIYAFSSRIMVGAGTGPSNRTVAVIVAASAGSTAGADSRGADGGGVEQARAAPSRTAGNPNRSKCIHPLSQG